MAGLRQIVAPENLYSGSDCCVCCFCYWQITELSLSLLLTVLKVSKNSSTLEIKSNLVITLQQENGAESKCLYTHCDLVCLLNTSIWSSKTGADLLILPVWPQHSILCQLQSVRIDSSYKRANVKGRGGGINLKHSSQRTHFKKHWRPGAGDGGLRAESGLELNF